MHTITDTHTDIKGIRKKGENGGERDEGISQPGQANETAEGQRSRRLVAEEVNYAGRQREGRRVERDKQKREPERGTQGEAVNTDMREIKLWL